MPLKPGTKLGPYEILAQLGAGGMGEVYKGRDTRLERLVAIKTLPAHLAERPELRERFKREAHAIANLKHAHICVLYDIGSQELEAEEVAPPSRLPLEPAGSRRYIDYLVMEYLEGETLSERLKKGPLALDQVLRYAEELADALDTAHRAEFTHRDIKPGNIMLTKEGSKLLDFGLAKMKQEIAQAITPASERPTVPGTLTEQGTLLGTLQYMAPEQVEGKVDEIDARTDIFAFGAVVYEMATRKKAFDGQTQASVIAKILEVDPPPISSLEPPGKLSPPALDRVVKRCLVKDRNERWQTAYDLWQDVKWIKEGGSQTASATVKEAKPPARAWRRAMPLSLAAVAVLAVGVAIGARILRPSSPTAQAPAHVTIMLPPGDRLAETVEGGGDSSSLAISPDGSRIAYAAIRGGIQQLYLRALDNPEAKALPGTEGGFTPFFSPDGQWIGFTAGGKLKKVSISGGTTLVLAEAPVLRGASWGPDDTIVYAPTPTSGLMRVSAAGGAPQVLTTLDRSKGETSHRSPQFLPGGKAIVFFREGQLALHNLENGEERDLIQGEYTVGYIPTGHLVYSFQGRLLSVPFDPVRLEVTNSSPVTIVEAVSFAGISQGTVDSSVNGGILAYLPANPGQSEKRLVWVDRSGKAEPLLAPPGDYLDAALSPYGSQVAVTRDRDIWIYDLGRGTLTPLTSEGTGQFPVWTPDGKRVTYTGRGVREAGLRTLFWKMADGSAPEEELVASENRIGPSGWSPDGKVLAFDDTSPTTGEDISILRVEDDPRQAGAEGRKPQPFLRAPFAENRGAFSLDGRWLAYESNESGRVEVYVQPFPGPGGRAQISTEGGTRPVWARNGRELFYIDDDQMMAVEVTTQPGFRAGRPRLLFKGRFPPAATTAGYGVSPDGQRFLMIQPVEPAQPATQINVVLNWFEELKRRVPAAR